MTSRSILKIMTLHDGPNVWGKRQILATSTAQGLNNKGPHVIIRYTEVPKKSSSGFKQLR